MKKSLLIASLLTGVCLVNMTQVHAMDKNMEEKLVKVCEAAKSDSRIKLQQAISNVSTGYKEIAESLVCNGVDPITFALNNGSVKTAKLLASRSQKDFDEMLAKL
tara:strand:+ start:563 stop:877 length:315 start_codon:yes stop_codon:yes gene_type:complete